MTDVETSLLRFIADEVAAIPLDLASDTDLLLSGAVDSLGVIRITQWIEDNLGVLVDPADVTLENFQTVRCMADYVASRRGAQ